MAEIMEARIVLSISESPWKLAAPLPTLFDQYEAFVASGGQSSAFASPAASELSVIKGAVKVEVVAQGDLGTLLSDLSRLDFRVTASLPGVSMADGYAPLSMLPKIASLPQVTKVEPVWNVMLSDSQGSQSNAAENTMLVASVRTLLGVTGAGVTIGVISDSAGQVGGGLAASVASGDLPPAPQAQIIVDGPGGSDEGRAMMEEIYDMAPGASLRFYAAGGTDLSMATAINGLVAAGCTVIVDDINGLTSEPYLQDGLTSQAIVNAVNGGVTYLSSSGNRGNSGFSAPFSGVTTTVAGINSRWDDFGGGVFTQQVTIQPGNNRFYFQFDDPTNNVTHDAELYILDSTGTTVLANSANPIGGYLPGTTVNVNNPNASAITVRLAVRAVSGGDIGRFQYIGRNLSGGADPTIVDLFPGPGVFHNGVDPTHEASLSSISIAAANVATPTTPESFTGVGPVLRVFDPAGVRLANLEVRNKPDLTANDGIATSVPGFNPFFGTSAAVPNAGAVAALIKSFRPGFTPAQIRQTLINGAVDIGATGYDLVTGYGLINAMGSMLTLVNGTLDFYGDRDYVNENDTLLLEINPSDPTVVDITLNGAFQGSAPLAQLQQINFFGLGGNDTLIVDSTNGLIPLARGIIYDGGTGFNNLVLQQTGGATQTTDTYSVGPNNGDGSSVIVGGGLTQTVQFQNLAPVLDLVPAGVLVVNGTAADNAINYTAGGVAANGLVTIDNFESIEFSNKTNLSINAAAGSDTINLNNPNTPTGLTGLIGISGADPTGSDTLIVNGIIGTLDNLRLVPSNIGSGTVINDTAAQPNVVFAGIEHLKLVVQAVDGDGVRVDGTTGNDNIEFTPGATADSGVFTGTMDLNNATGAGPFQMVETTYFGVDSAVNDEDVNVFNPGGTDSIVYNGTSGNDAITVGVGEAGGAEFRNTINGQVVSRLEVFNATTAIIRGLSGDDTITVSPTILTSLSIEGGDPSASDVVNLNGDGTAVTATIGGPTQTVTGGGLGTVTLSGVEVVNLNAAAGDITFNGTAGPDAFLITPTGANTADVQVAALAPLFHTTNTGALTINDGTAGDGDSATVNGTTGNDTINVVRAATTTVTVNALKTISLTSANIEALIVAAGLGGDAINVSGTGGTPLTVDGGDPTSNAGGVTDTLNITYPTAGAVTTVAPGATPDAGTINNTSDGLTAFSHIEFISLTATGAANTLVANGTNGNDSIALQFLGGANRIWVNDRAVVSFSTYQTVNLNGLFGDDTFSVSPVGLTGVTAINVSGGDPTASDALVVNGSLAADAINIAPTAPDGGSVAITGSPTVTFSTTEKLTVNGGGGNDALTVTTPAGAQAITYTPGAAVDAASVQVDSLVPISFLNLGTGGTVNLADTGGTRVDSLTYNGTAADDTFNVAATGAITLVNLQVPVGTAGVASITLNGFDGDDTFNVAGALPAGLTSLVLSGGNPTASDIANLSGASGPVTITFGTVTTVTGYGGTISLPGIEILNANVNGNALTVNGTAQDDVVTYQPTGPNAGTVTRAGVNPVTPIINFTAVIGTFTFDSVGGGFDELDVLGTNGDDVVTSSSSAITVNGNQPVTIGAGVDRLVLSTLDGSDNITFSLTIAGIQKIIDAGAGNDVVDASLAADITILGGAGDDNLTGTAQGDRIEGGDGNDTIEGGPGNDSLFGGDGSDTFTWDPGDGSDLIEGGGGQNILQFDGNTSAETFNLFANGTRFELNHFVNANPAGTNITMDCADIQQVNVSAQGGGDTVHVFNLFDTQVGVINIDVGPDAVRDDVIIEGRNVADEIQIAQSTVPPVGPGSSAVDVEGLKQHIFIFNTTANCPTLPGDDVLTINGNQGNDQIVAAPGVENQIGLVFNGGLGNDLLQGNGTLNGGDGNDTLVGATGDCSGLCALVENGGNGNDVIIGSAANDTIDGGAGNDSIWGGAGDDTINGGDGNDFIAANDGNDTVDGGAGNDTVAGGAGNDLIFGSAGNDLLLGDADADCDSQSTVLVAIASGQGNDTVSGGADNDTVNGDVGNDLLFGNDGNDVLGPTVVAGVLFTDAGDDTMLGGNGNDTINGDSGNDLLLGEADNDFILGSGGNDTILGGAGNDTITGGDGNDLILGETGDDLALGDAGNDTIYGGDGNDTIAGGDGNDLIYGNGGNDIVFGNAGDDSMLGGDGNDTMLGGTGNDSVCGEAGNDWLSGEAGDDVIDGAAGNDIAYGGDGNDQIFGGIGADVLVGDAGNDSIVAGDGNDVVYGGDGNDLIFGEAGNDTVLGGNGNDAIYGGIGNDWLLGGTVATANILHSVRPHLPSDGDDLIAGGLGYDVVDGGNGNNLLDAGADGIPETVLGGLGNDFALIHGHEDFGALDGGLNRVFSDLAAFIPEIVPPAETCTRVVFPTPLIPVLHGQLLQPGFVPGIPAGAYTSIVTATSFTTSTTTPTTTTKAASTTTQPVSVPRAASVNITSTPFTNKLAIVKSATDPKSVVSQA